MLLNTLATVSPSLVLRVQRENYFYWALFQERDGLALFGGSRLLLDASLLGQDILAVVGPGPLVEPQVEGGFLLTGVSSPILQII